MKLNELINDIKKYLVTKKSASSLQTQLNNIQQRDLSISEYGSQLENLFSDLTIAQADGNTEAYNILQPINEKLALKRFSDGLRNRRIGTIISARNYEHLKDAVRAAEDEQVSSLSYRASGDVMNMRRGRGHGPPTRAAHYQHTQRPARGKSYNNNYNFDNRNYHSRSGTAVHTWGPANNNRYRSKNQTRGKPQNANNSRGVGQYRRPMYSNFRKRTTYAMEEQNKPECSNRFFLA